MGDAGGAPPAWLLAIHAANARHATTSATGDPFSASGWGAPSSGAERPMPYKRQRVALVAVLTARLSIGGVIHSCAIDTYICHVRLPSLANGEE